MSENQQRIDFESVPQRRLLIGVVFAPNQMTTHDIIIGEQELEIMAHNFLKNQSTKQVDFMHNNERVAAQVVESYINRDPSSKYPLGAWVVAVKVEDEKLWSLIENHTINSFSAEVYSFLHGTKTLVPKESLFYGKTQRRASETHSHTFACFQKEGADVYGKTSSSLFESADDVPHYHLINSSCQTGVAISSVTNKPLARNQHTHSFSLTQVEV